MREKSPELVVLTENYYQLIPPKKSWLELLLTPFIFVYSIVRNAFAICLGRLLAFAIFNPGKADNHNNDNVHYANNPKHPDPEHEADFHVVNVVSRPGFFLKIAQNYARRIQGRLPELPERLSQFLKYVLRLNVISQADCEAFIGRTIFAITNGKTSPTPIDLENTFIKGLEFIDGDLRVKTLAAINLMLSTHSGKDAFDICDNASKANFFSLETIDHAVLDSVELRAKGEHAKPMRERTFVIFCMPRSNGYCAWLRNLKIAADKANTTYVAFNYRGVERSQGLVWTQDDMINDACAQAERLLLMGAKAENIAFEGECVGGAIATLAAAKMHKQGCNVKLFNARSFRSASRLVLHKILPGDNASLLNPLTYGRYLFAGLFYVVGQPILYLAHWDLNVEKAWDTIPNKDKDFIVVRSHKNNDGTHNKDDGMIEHQHASIYSLVRKKLDKALFKDELSLNELHQHRFIVDPEMSSNAKTRDGHVCARYQLTQRDNVGANDIESMNKKTNAREYTANFYHRMWHHAVKQEGVVTDNSASAFSFDSLQHPIP